MPYSGEPNSLTLFKITLLVSLKTYFFISKILQFKTILTKYLMSLDYNEHV